MCLACGGDGPVGPDNQKAVPPPGPNWAVSPIPLDSIARITPLGYNNNPLPTAHTYWLTCDLEYLMPSSRPCVRELLPIRAPADAVVRDVTHVADGSIVIEGPPGLQATFGHVTPTVGLTPGDSVEAGDVIATMFADHGFDLGVRNAGIDPHYFVRPERAGSIVEAQSPIAQFPEPLRSQMIARVQTMSDPLGALSYDVAGTTSGYWFRQGTPVNESFCVCQRDNHLFLGTLQERDDVRIMSVGELWPIQPNPLIVIDPAEPSWTEITPASGPVALRAWGLHQDGGPMYSYPHGTILVEMLDDMSMRVEWFDGHNPVSAFTSAARTYER